MAFSVMSWPERLIGVEGINKHKAINTATIINPRGSRKPRGLVRREKIFRRDIILLILHPFDRARESQRAGDGVVTNGDTGR
jgi:phosphopantothenate synthetase